MAKRILVGVDGSELAERAAHEAAVLGKATGAELELVCVHAPIIPPADLSPSVWAQLNADAMRQDAQLVRTLAERLESEGVPVHATVVEGSPPYELARIAESPEVTHVVVGKSGKGAVRKLLLGSVASRLSQLSPKPVVMVP